MVGVASELQAKTENRADAAIVAVAGYFLLAATTIHFTSDGRNHATMWPADALILALLLTRQRRDWVYILLAGWAANFMANAATRDWTPGLALYGAINMGQTWLAACFISKCNRIDDLLADGRTVMWFVVGGGVIAPLAGALTGSLVSLLNYSEPFLPSLVRWYVGNALGFLIVGPFLKAVLDGSYLRQFRDSSRSERIEAAVLLGAHTLVVCAIFSQTRLPLQFLTVSSVLILSFRLGRLGTTLGVMIVALVGATAAFRNAGPYTLLHGTTEFKEFYFQFYLAALLATTLPVAAIVASRTEALRNLSAREAALRLMMSHSPDGILSVDRTNHCTWAEGPLRTYLGMEPAEILGRSLDSISPPLSDRVSNMLSAGAQDTPQPATFEFSPIQRLDITLEASIGVLRREGTAVGTVITLRDTSKRKAKELAILSRAETDDLTGVNNRGGFSKRLTAALKNRESRPKSLALIDVDGFKSINDSHGHSIGDAVLVEIARRIQLATREVDVIGRIGGDEFAVLLNCEIATARAACERIAEAVRQTPVFSDGPISLLSSISCGVAEYLPGLSRDQVFDAADSALYEAKRSGRNTVRAAA